MRLDKAGADFIKGFEGLRLTAYHLGTEKYYTIGYGHYGPDVKKDMKISKEEADRLFSKDIERFEAEVNRYDVFYHWTQNEFNALVSFAYNIGSIGQLTDNGRRSKEVIAEKISLYVKSNGVILQGLVKRRAEEKKLFLSKSTIKSYVVSAPYTLRVNCKNTDVGLLQKQLNEVIGAGLVVDNIFGKKTRSAVIDFQKKVFSDPKEWDGIYGPKTKKKLEEELNK